MAPCLLYLAGVVVAIVIVIAAHNMDLNRLLNNHSEQTANVKRATQLVGHRRRLGSRKQSDILAALLVLQRGRRRRHSRSL